MRIPFRAAVAFTALGMLLASCSQSQGGVPTADSASESLVGSTSAIPTVLILDSSGSMSESEGDGTRMDAAKKAATGLVEALPDDAVLGLVAYGTSTGGSDAEKAAGCADVKTLQKAVALDRGVVTAAVSGLAPSGFTPIGASLRHAAELLPADGEVAIVLLSDGEDTCAPPPPCEVARELKQERPGLTISTVGFKTANEELSCIASATGGLYLTADNTDQLISRLVAAQNATGNANALTPTGFRGIELGQSVDQIGAAHPDFPAVAGGDQVVIVWMDCDWVFEGGVLTEIRPGAQAGFRTVDGLTAGASVSKAAELYGEAVEERANPDGTTTSLFTASHEAGTAWKVGHRDNKITTIYLCKCLPSAGGVASGSSARPTAMDVTDRMMFWESSYDDERELFFLAETDGASQGARPAQIYCGIGGTVAARFDVPASAEKNPKVACYLLDDFAGPQMARPAWCSGGSAFQGDSAALFEWGVVRGSCAGGVQFNSLGYPEYSESNVLVPGESVQYKDVTCVVSAGSVVEVECSDRTTGKSLRISPENIVLDG